MKVVKQVPLATHSLFLIVLIFVCYSNTFTVPWLLDDPPNIINNPPVRIDNLMPETLWQTFFAMPFDPGTLFRPVTMVTIALNWYVGQDNPAGYHIINLTIHILTTLILYQTILLLFQTPALKKYSRNEALFIALLGSALWAVNPIQIQAVTYIVQRMAAMVAMFSIWSIFWYLRFRLQEPQERKYTSLLLCILCYILAVGSKENGVILPWSILALEFIFFPKAEDRFTKIVRTILVTVSCTLLLAAASYIIQHDYFEYLFKPINRRAFTISERLLTEPGILLFYLSLILYPLAQRFSIDHEVTIIDSLWGNWTAFPAITLIFGLIILAIISRKKQPLLSFAILFFFINHLVESTIIPLELIFEHRNYLPSLFLFLPVAAGIHYLLQVYSMKNRLIHVLILLFIPLLLSVTGWNTYLRNSVWASEESLWLDAMQKAPNNARPAAKLGELAGWNKEKSPQQLALSIGYYKKSLTGYTPMTSFKAAIYGNMGEVFFMYGLYNQALTHFEQSLALNKHFNNSLYGLAKTLVMKGKFEEALQQVDTVLEEEDRRIERFLNLRGLILLWLNRPGEAVESIGKAMRMDIQKQKYFYNLGVALSRAGYHSQAEWFLAQSNNVPSPDIKILFSLLENSIRAEENYKSDKICEAIARNFSIDQIELSLKTVQQDYRSIPIAVDLITPVLFQHIYQRAILLSPPSGPMINRIDAM